MKVCNNLPSLLMHSLSKVEKGTPADPRLDKLPLVSEANHQGVPRSNDSSAKIMPLTGKLSFCRIF